ncbi:MAG: alpha/beta hydrolase [Rhizobacter sp.]|nr:alpha/beta hydrolase [Rhizobacter sp.]
MPSASQIDPAKVYGWLEGGGKGVDGTGDVGKATLYMQSQYWAPARTNLKPMTLTFADSGKVSLDGSVMVPNNWYPSERYDGDMSFVGTYTKIQIAQNGVAIDIDKSTIDSIPVYVARQATTRNLVNPFPKVSDFTEVNKTGTYQSASAAALSPFDPAINVATYSHSDFISADDSIGDTGIVPGTPGASAVSNTLVDWLLKRAKGRATVPTPESLGVVRRF